MRAEDASHYGWQSWPAEFRAPDSSAVGEFADTHAERAEFFLYLQWMAAQQLNEALAAARACGVGFYRDLAVGSDLGGADTWGDRRAFITQASLGAPGDMHNDAGQFWGLAPLSPRALREQGYAPLAALLRANMRHACVLRIDHVMALAARLLDSARGERARGCVRALSARGDARRRRAGERPSAVCGRRRRLGDGSGGFSRTNAGRERIIVARALLRARLEQWSVSRAANATRDWRQRASERTICRRLPVGGRATAAPAKIAPRDRYLLVDAFELPRKSALRGMPALYAAGVTGDAAVVPEVVRCGNALSGEHAVGS